MEGKDKLHPHISRQGRTCSFLLGDHYQIESIMMSNKIKRLLL